MRVLNRFGITLASILAYGCSESSVGPRSNADYDLLFVASEKSTPGEDIFRMNPDGTGRENLTNMSTTPAGAVQAAVVYRSMTLSPDGQSIAFEANREGCPGVWGMNVDGSGIRKLSIGIFQTTRCNYFPVYSPDGSMIAFMTSREGLWSVYVMNADGTNPHNVSSPIDKNTTATNFPVSWSADGRVVFHHSTGSRFEAYTVKPDGTDLGLFFGRATDHSPEWSPDKSRIAFIRDTDTGSKLFVMNADGSNVRQLTTHAGEDMLIGDVFENDYSNWSADGRKIVYTNQAELHVINVDGTNDVKLTSSADFNGWSPDGRITFSSNTSGSDDIYLINSDGTGVVNLTNSANTNEVRALWVKRR